MAKSSLSGGLKDAFESYGKAGEGEGEEVNPTGDEDGAQHDSPDDLHAILHLNHKESGKHSTHMVDHEGKATSKEHMAGEGGADCPHCE